MLKGQEVYWARIMPKYGTYDVIDLKLRTVNDEWFCGTDKATKQAHLFDNASIGEIVFIDRKDAVDRVKFAESNYKVEVSNEVYYEEY